MKSEKLSTEIAALERKIKDAKNATVKKVLEKKIESLKAELKKEDNALPALSKAKKKIREMSQKDFNEFIKTLSKKDGFSFLKSMTSDEIKRDIQRVAKPVGWRFRGDNTKKPTRKDIKEGNNVYWEGRRNRSDVSRSVKLETGGSVGISVSEFEKKIKDLMKQENKWHFLNEVVDGKTVRMKFFVGKKEVDVQIFTIDNIGAKMPRNYSGKRDTVGMIMENFGSKMEWGGTAESSETGDFIGGENQSSMYAKGGSLFDEPHRTEMSGMMAKGGATSMFKYEIYAENTNTGEKSTVALVKSYGDIPLMITGLKMGVKSSPIKYGFKENK